MTNTLKSDSRGVQNEPRPKSSPAVRLLIAALGLVAFIAAPSSASAQHGIPSPPPKADYRSAPPSNNIDWDMVSRVYELICKAGIREPKIVMRQAILETGWFRSAPLMKINNLFGFRHAAYLTFDRWEDSVDYYKTWQDTYLTTADQNYFSFLERIRYAVPGYTRYLKTIAWDEECP